MLSEKEDLEKHTIKDKAQIIGKLKFSCTAAMSSFISSSFHWGVGLAVKVIVQYSAVEDEQIVT